MKNKLSTKEQKILDDAFAMLEGCINNLAKNECLSLDNIHKAIHYSYDVASGGTEFILVGEPHKGRSGLVEFMQTIFQKEQPVTSWPDAEEEGARGEIRSKNEI